MSKTVLVTGISGFIGLYCVKELLNKGYKVKGTVRNSSKQNEVINTFKKNKINIKNLKFEILDLTSDNGWDNAIEGCDFVMHVASPFRIAIPKNEDEMILPAVEGTRRVFFRSFTKRWSQKNSIDKFNCINDVKYSSWSVWT